MFVADTEPVIDKLNAAVNAAVKRPDIVSSGADQGAVAMSMTPEEFDKYLRGDIVKWGKSSRNSPTSRNKVHSMSSVRFRLNGVGGRRGADPDCSLLGILRGTLGMTGPHFGCGANECGACNVWSAVRRHMRHAVVVGRGQDVTTPEGWEMRKRPPAAACVYRRAGPAVPSAFRHPDQRRSLLKRNLVRPTTT
jgi:hypothetical protein